MRQLLTEMYESSISVLSHDQKEKPHEVVFKKQNKNFLTVQIHSISVYGIQFLLLLSIR